MSFYLKRVLSIFTIMIYLKLCANTILPGDISSMDLTYNDCSSVFCTSCLNPYQCQTCSYNYQPACCPKFCSSCIDMNHCLECDMFFVLKSLDKNVICTRVYNSTDFNRQSDGQCSIGFYFQPITASCLNCNSANCQTCTTYQNCSFCNAGYYLWNQTFVNSIYQTYTQQVCLPCSSNCLVCQNKSACTICQTGYYSSLNLCVQCQIQYCSACSSQSLCTTCVFGTFLNASQCQICQQKVTFCSNCSISSQNLSLITCNFCQLGYYLSNNTCETCPQNCQSCSIISNKLTCSQCKNNFTLNNMTNTCTQCFEGCLTCTFYPIANTNDCSQCIDGYFIVFSNQTKTTSCALCTFPCISCVNNSLLCAECQIGFYVNKQSSYGKISNLQIGLCYFCNLENCISCSSASQCTVCEDGYYIKLQITTSIYGCTVCPLNCLTCKSNNSTFLGAGVQCFECISGFYLSNNTCIVCQKSLNCLTCNPSNPLTCLQCLQGYYLDVFFNICVDVCNISQCQVCNRTINPFTTIEQGNCLECNQGFYLVQNTTGNFSYCMPCYLNCRQCTNQTNCIQCLQKYYIFMQNNQQICQKCQESCLYCNTNGCLFCEQGFYPSPIKQIFINQSVNVKCSLCNSIAGCVTCFNQNYCKQCSSLRYSQIPSIFGNCTPCLSNCLTCDEQLQCSLCNDGYLYDQSTNACLDQNGIPIWAIFVICTFSIAFILILIERSFSYIRNRRIMKRLMLQEKIKQKETSKDFIQLEIPMNKLHQ